MDELIEFLRARLDEDEAGWKAVAAREDGIVPVTHFRGEPLARRMLREAAAKRAILDDHESYVPDDGPHEGEPCCGRCGAVGDDPWYAVSWPCRTVLELAGVWSDHPDYRAEWKP